MATEPGSEWETQGIIVPLQNFTEEMLTRLEEFENIISVTRETADVANSNISKIAAQKEELFKLCKRIDDLDRFIEVIDKEVTNMEKVVNVAETELGVTEGKGISSMFKNIFKKSPSASNLNADGVFQPPLLLDPSVYFKVPDESVNEEVDHTAQDALLDSDFFNDTEDGEETVENNENIDQSSSETEPMDER